MGDPCSSPHLVPLGTSLFPPSLAAAFGLPLISYGPGLPDSSAPTAKPMPISAPELRKSNSAVYVMQPPAFQPSNWPMQIQHNKPIFQGNQPKTTGSSDQIGSNYGMYVPYPPQFASSLPGVMFHQPKTNGTVAEYSSLSFSGGHGQQHSGFLGGGGGMRSNPAATTITDTTDEDQGDGARAVKRARLVWTPQLHKRFEEAVSKLGNEKSIPKNIMQEMNVEGLTRENVASHLQKFRLMQRGGPTESGSHSGDKEKGTCSAPQ